MPLSFKTETPNTDLNYNRAQGLQTMAARLQTWLSWASLGLSLVGFCLAFGAIRSIHPQKAVEITCDSDMLTRLEQSAAELERVRAQVLNNNTTK